MLIFLAFIFLFILDLKISEMEQKNYESKPVRKVKDKLNVGFQIVMERLSSYLTIRTISDYFWAIRIHKQQGGRKQTFYGGATVNSEKWIFKNSQNLLNKSPKDGGAIAPPVPR